MGYGVEKAWANSSAYPKGKKSRIVEFPPAMTIMTAEGTCACMLVVVYPMLKSQGNYTAFGPFFSQEVSRTLRHRTYTPLDFLLPPAAKSHFIFPWRQTFKGSFNIRKAFGATILEILRKILLKGGTKSKMLVASGLLAGSKVLVPGIARGLWKWKNMIRKGTNSNFGG